MVPAEGRGREKSEWATTDVYRSDAGTEATVSVPAEAEGGGPIPADLSDADLIGRAARGMPGRLRCSTSATRGWSSPFALRLVADRQLAEEVLQEVFFRAWQQGRRLQRPTGDVRHLAAEHHPQLAIDEIRKRKRRPQKADSEEPETVLAAVADTSAGADVEGEVWLGSLRTTVAEALKELRRRSGRRSSWRTTRV
jgi:RNA polymerase sigma-70 factor (ECF subfamily)